MQWAPRVRQWRIRRLYHFAKSGIYDNDALQHIGIGLYCRCVDVLTVADAYGRGLVPCPGCGTKVQRRIDPLYRMEGHGRGVNWFSCPHCSNRLLWDDCRRRLREAPVCFDCGSPLEGTDTLRCAHCAKSWDRRAYLRSVARRVRLPCPHCNQVIRKPASPETDRQGSQSSRKQALICPGCKGTAFHEAGYIHCAACGYRRRWRDYRKGQKRRDEALECNVCGHVFRWQAWRRNARWLATGNPQPARDFAKKWPVCRTPQERMMQIDSLLQTLHGRGPLAPYFIEGDERSIRQLLDELATQV